MMKPWSMAGAVLLAACAVETPGEMTGSPAPTGDSALSTGSTGDPSTSDTTTATGGLDQDEGGLSHLSMFLTDAPAAYEHVWVTIDEVEVELDGAWQVVSDEALHLDLLELRGGVLAALGDALLEPGYIGQIRLHVLDAAVTVDGTDHPLEIPSGAQTGIKIPLDEQIVEGAAYELVLDFDALRSVKKTGHGYIMKPVILVQEFEMVSDTSGLGGFGGALVVESDGHEDQEGEAAEPEGGASGH